MSHGRDQFLVALEAIKAEYVDRAARRHQVAHLVTAGQEWLAKFDAQEAAAAQAFADAQPEQFAAFVEALPEVTLDAAEPAHQVP